LKVVSNISVDCRVGGKPFQMMEPRMKTLLST